ncbi:calcineurin binding protein, putative [Cordyceps militaris CM01]|uniref:Calcineurin binding protein, putative n=1 Tax=Cordyceps militaris (strain CM01) TaxID=983644 RepID=G3JEU1_CORMM|nr:calcineurin binding protein, putative [Cordyceps militaris CM01]EGX93050.1 calcineurin binding protein, putative [Cordyceps militaris CM01]
MELSPKPSRSSSTSSRRGINLTLDLSNLPPLEQPTPPSNTLLFTNLDNVDIFRADKLQSIRDLINRTATIHAFAPLKSFRRILVSFYDVESAVSIRRIWDGEAIMGQRVRIYFGHPTSIQTKPDHLALPDAGKLFFISPPPSPPHGWEVRLEDAPNKMVHADDLAEALARLGAGSGAISSRGSSMDSPVTPVDGAAIGRRRSRSSTLIYHPDAHGSGFGLPAVFVEDMTDEPEEMSPLEAKPIQAHTSRPPVELMHDA